jgi:predicted Zn-dependent peptidase
LVPVNVTQVRNLYPPHLTTSEFSDVKPEVVVELDSDDIVIKHDRVSTTILPNGLAITTDPQATRQAVLMLGIKAGSADELPGEYTAAHYVEHMSLAESSKWKSREEHTRQVNAMHGKHNGITDCDNVVYFYRCSMSFYDEAIAQLAACVKKHAFSHENFLTEQAAIFREADLRLDNRPLHTYDNTYPIAYEGSPLANTAAGTHDEIQAITPNVVNDYKERNYIPSKMHVIATGNVNHEAVVAAAEKAGFRDLTNSQSLTERTRLDPKWHSGHKMIPASGSMFLRMSFPLKTGDYTQSCVNKLGADMLGSDDNSLLVRKLRHEQQYAYMASAKSNEDTDVTQLAILTNFSGKNAKAVIDTIAETIREFPTTITDAGLEDKKNNWIGECERDSDDIFKRAAQLEHDWRVFGRTIPFKEYQETVAKISLNDIQHWGKNLVSEPVVVVQGGEMENFPSLAYITRTLKADSLSTQGK